ncbi:MAG: metalloregulator ArsR/SmtB family transcription factor [Parvularculales bacterium]
MDKFATLADPNRRSILEMLARKGQLSVKDINDGFDISAPAVSQHLKVLREADLISVEKQAQQRIYSINTKGIDEVWAWLNMMRQYWNERFDALDTLLIEDTDNGQ